ILMSNSSSSSMTSSTVSSESAPKSFTNEVSGVIFSLSTPSCSATISITRSATDATFTVLQEGSVRLAGWPLYSQLFTNRYLRRLIEFNRIEEIRKLGQDEGQCRMSKAKCRRKHEARMTKVPFALRISSFVIHSTFDFSTFVILA